MYNRIRNGKVLCVWKKYETRADRCYKKILEVSHEAKFQGEWLIFGEKAFPIALY